VYVRVDAYVGERVCQYGVFVCLCVFVCVFCLYASMQACMHVYICSLHVFVYVLYVLIHVCM